MSDILKSPYVSASLQATLFSAVSYVIGQVVLSLKDNDKFSVDIDYTVLGRFVSWALVSTPIGILWQQTLDIRFPSTKPKHGPSGRAISKDSPKEYHQLNIFVKVVLTETIFSIAFNSAFIAYITYLEHGDLKMTIAKVRTDVPELWTSSIKVWPLVTYVSFGFLPPQFRVAFTSVVGLVWGIYVNAFVISK
ncbi:hypothetical protein V1517DRAFT_319455 [Lipomyces orientalis]|uniref:Uncharacterized protein n=1 Tax=Lipomyces orientalis TaxID=1233043 RepID=A0ACC3TRQ5_9ASCO